MNPGELEIRGWTVAGQPLIAGVVLRRSIGEGEPPFTSEEEQEVAVREAEMTGIVDLHILDWGNSGNSEVEVLRRRGPASGL